MTRLAIVALAAILAECLVLAAAGASPDASEIAVYDFSDIHESLWLAVVIDRSGSMQARPMARARAQAAATLRSLRPAASFSLTSFAASAESWRDGWTEAREFEVDLARAWLDSLVSRDVTCPSAGIAAALATPAPIPESTAVLLITDGDPDGDGQLSRAACVEAAGEAPILVLLVIDPRGPRAEACRSWGRRLAEATGGDCREVAP